MRTKFNTLLAIAALVPLLFVSLAARTPDPGAPPLDDKSVDAVAKLVYPAVVRVEARNGMRKMATGVVVDRDGYIITTALISPRDEEITVVTTDGKRIKADFVGLDSQTRMAVLKAKEKLPAAIPMGKSEGLVPGAWVGVVGLSPENTPSVTQGIVSSVAPDWLRLNVWVVRGASGSPVINKDGQMIGLLRGAYFEDNPVLFEFHEQQVVGQGYAFSRAEAPASGMAQAIPVDIVRDVYAQIKDKGKVERGWLGVNAGDNEQGQLVIQEVEDNSPADLAKLKEGDVILKLDGKPVNGASLMAEVRMRKPGKDITLTVLRNGKTMDVKVKLGEYSEEDARLEIERSFPQLFMGKGRPRGEAAPGNPGGPGAKAPGVIPGPGPQPFNMFWEKRKFIGFYVSETTKELGEFFGLKDGPGLLVNEFTDNSPAQKAGLKVGDVVFKADGKRIQSVSELAAVLQTKKKSDKIKIEFMRDKKPLSVDVEVGEEESQTPMGLSEQFLWDGNGLSVGPSDFETLSKAMSRNGDLVRQMGEDWKKRMDQSKPLSNVRLIRDSNTYRI